MSRRVYSQKQIERFVKEYLANNGLDVEDGQVTIQSLVVNNNLDVQGATTYLPSDLNQIKVGIEGFQLQENQEAIEGTDIVTVVEEQ